MTDEAAIRELITHRGTAVHDGDLDSVLTEHDSDIVIFDVPPFFEWQRQSAESRFCSTD
jgi:ketosteroid isomerase-like protein